MFKFQCKFLIVSIDLQSLHEFVDLFTAEQFVEAKVTIK